MDLMQLDAVIFGGGAAGLWVLDELTRRGNSALLIEAHALGHGQTVASQGIIHGGLKYTLAGLFTPAAQQIREMPNVWRSCLAGDAAPDLSRTRVRSPFCYLWRTDSIGSRLGMIGASIGLRVAPRSLDDTERPPILDGCPGSVARLDEQVISPASFVAELAARHRDWIVQATLDEVEFDTRSAGEVRAVRVREPCDGLLAPHPRPLSPFGGEERLIDSNSGSLEIRPRCVIFTAGAGNSELRAQVGLATHVMQRRPLHMVLLRGELPQFCGHCVDGTTTRVTITSDTDAAGRTIWQVGGQLAEDGVAWDRSRLVAHARSELAVVLPSLDLRRVEFGTYRVDRAEGRTPSGARPDSIQILREGNTITAWPTKLALAPLLASEIIGRAFLPDARTNKNVHVTVDHRTPTDFDPIAWQHWPRPAVAAPPWEVEANWSLNSDASSAPARAA
jgi:glycerol-3-phosphate dehydrogenase